MSGVGLIPEARVRSEVTAARQLAADLIAECLPGERLDAHELISRHPQLLCSRSAVVDLTYEEFCRRTEQGERLVAAEFASRFPAVQRSLLHVIEVHRLLMAESAMWNLGGQPLWPKKGESWLGYDLLDQLGEGAFSRVFLAQEQSLGGRQVVLKVTPLGSREARTLAELAHPQIVPVYSVRRDEDRGLTGICMPFLSRMTLFDVVDGVFARTAKPTRGSAVLEAVKCGNPIDDRTTLVHPQPAWPARYSYVEAMLTIGIQLADALEHAHRHATLHCDVKPSNVLLSNQGHAYLLDFNLALLGADAARCVGGTLPYMSPEQLEPLTRPGQPQPSQVDVQTDIFSLGVVLYEMLSGKLPFGGISESWSREQIASHLYARQKTGPLALRDAAPSVDPQVAAIVARCLEFSADRRWPSMAVLADEMRKQLTVRSRLLRRVRTHRRPILAASTVALAGLLAGATALATRDSLTIREFGIAQVAFEQGYFKEAVKHCTRALDSDSTLVEAQFLRACANLNDGKSMAAEGDFTELLELVPDGRAAAGLAYTYAIRSGDNLLIVEFNRRAIHEGFATAIVYNNLGECLRRESKLEEARDALGKALALDPQLAQVHHNLARCEFRIALDRNVLPDLQYIESALSHCEETGELDLDAAIAFAVVARDAKDERIRQNSHVRALEFCRRGVERGMTAQMLEQVCLFHPALKDDPQFRKLSPREAVPGEAPVRRLIVNPLVAVPGVDRQSGTVAAPPLRGVVDPRN
ncbi:MAG: tetratricopeptide repeat protein [Planctomycetaceae bacterium]|nr:tetratricopeptide repeat protein [Planctomycetaceae bacterium]